MSVLPFKPCPNCSTVFQPKRKNQVYCSTDCRTDINNAAAKGRYAAFKEGVPKMDSVKAELKRMREYVAGLTIVLKDVTKVDADTLAYGGRRYKRGTKVGRTDLGVVIAGGSGILLPGNKIIYRPIGGNSLDNCWEYSIEK